MGPKKKLKAKKKIVEIKPIEMPKIFKPIQHKQIEVKTPLNNEHLLKEINYRLDLFKNEMHLNIFESKEIKDNTFKDSFYKNIYLLKSQIDLNDDKYLRSIQIQNLWEYYEKNLKFYYDVNYINKRTTGSSYEKHDFEDTNKISNAYWSSNVPLFFESEHTTDDAGILPPKDRLKESKTKHVNIPDDNTTEKPDKDDFEDNEKEMFNNTFASGFNLRSTQYTQFPTKQPVSQNSTGMKFFVPSKEQYKIDHLNSKREIKSSYGYNRPNYNLDNLTIEHKFLIEKHKDLAEKRHIEEQKEFIDKWGKARSYYKTALDNKYELIDRTEKAVKLLDKEKELKEKRIKSAFSAYENKSENEAKENEAKNQNIEEGVSEEPIAEEENPIVPRINLQNQKMTGVNKNEVEVKIQLKSVNDIVNKKDIKLKEIQLDPEAIDLPSDSLPYLKALFPAFDARNNYAQHLDIKKVDNVKTTYKHAYNPLSAYDTINIAKDKSNQRKNEVKSLRPTTGSDLLRSKQFNYSNLLESRRLVSGLNENIVKNIKSSQISNMQILDSNKLKERFLISDDIKLYNKYFLPNFEQMLIQRPEEVVAKKKRPKSKK